MTTQPSSTVLVIDDTGGLLEGELTTLTEPMPVHEASTGQGVAVMAVKTDYGVAAAYVPVAMGRLGDDGIEAASHLQHHLLEIKRLQSGLGPLVQEAREAGMSWDLIGWCLGVTGRAAAKRYADSFGVPLPRPTS